MIVARICELFGGAVLFKVIDEKSSRMPALLYIPKPWKPRAKKINGRAASRASVPQTVTRS